MGSDMSYEDMSSRQLNEYNFKIIGDIIYDSTFCYLLESKPAEYIITDYSKHITWVDSILFLPLKTLWITGFLRSPSINIVFLPRLAYVIAKFNIVVVFPSPGPGLDIIKLPWLPFFVYIRLVLKPRYASEIGDLGSSCVNNRLSIFSVFIDNVVSNKYEGVHTVKAVPSTTTYTAEVSDASYSSGNPGATFHRLGLAVAASGGGTGFVNGSEILVTGTSNNDGYYTVKSTRNSDSQLIVQKDLTAEVGTSAAVKSLPKEDYLL